jgi:hypothetical protein
VNLADSLERCATGLRAAPFNGGLLIVLPTITSCRVELCDAGLCDYRQYSVGKRSRRKSVGLFTA